MYKLLLSLRYLRTRWIALASIISVTLGVATLIVVNAVMGGFATEMMDRVRGVLSDVIIKGGGQDGFPDAELHMRRIEQALGDKLEAMTPVVETLGLLTFNVRGRSIPEPVVVKGINIDTYVEVGKFREYLHDPGLRANPSFAMRDDILAAQEPWRNWDLGREEKGAADSSHSHGHDSVHGADSRAPVMLGPPVNADQPDAAPLPSDDTQAALGRSGHAAEHHDDPFQQQSLIEPSATVAKHRGIIVPWLLASYRLNGKDYEVIKPGDDVLLTLPSASLSKFKIEGRIAQCTTVGRFRSGMSEYDQSHCYVDIRDLQEIRGMSGRVNAIEIKLKEYSDAPAVIRQLTTMFPPGYFTVHTWEQEQRSLLTAVQIEQGILNVLLFMIIAVAGFGILAIFFMIVVEKTRDIGILKSLGASDAGVMQIFLTYGISLGAVGGGLGMAMGLTIVVFLDPIERFLSWVSGQDIFSRDLYYFDKIPTVISWWSVSWIVGGAVLIALLASVLPARRAAALRPVEALRYE